MDYTFVSGYRGSKLVYAEKNLYVKKCARPNGNTEYICYQTVLSQKKDQNENAVSDFNAKQNKFEHEPNCTARVIIKPDGTISRNKIPHVLHKNHEYIVADTKSIKEMEELCTLMKEKLPLSAHKITPKEIFLQIMAK